MVFSNINFKMKKYFFSIVLLLSVVSINSQRNQMIAYIDMEYILENVPEYLEAQNTLDAKVAKWRKKIDDETRNIEVLKTDLANEKAILTKEIITEKEEEIALKQEELRRLEELYFGPNGDMFLIRKQLVKPIQDQVYNAIQDIAARKNYDFVFEKSSDLIMLYSNKKYDISDLVLSTIDRERLKQQKEDLKKEKQSALKNTDGKKELTVQQEEALKKIEEVKEKKLEDREAKKIAIEEKRKELEAKREEQRRILREKQEALKKKKEEERKKKEEEKKKKEEQNKENNNN